jgi:hypothetical protein
MTIKNNKRNPPGTSPDKKYRLSVITHFWFLDVGLYIGATGYWILDTGYWILDTGYWILDTGYYKILVQA